MVGAEEEEEGGRGIVMVMGVFGSKRGLDGWIL